jgi:hypothetical protein
MIRIIFWGALLIAGGSTVLAADSRGGFTMVGSRTCSDVVKDIDNKSVGAIGDMTAFLVLESMMAGYLTEYNNLTPDTINIAPKAISGVLPFVHDYCGAHPAKSIYDALDAFTKDAYPNRQH